MALTKFEPDPDLFDPTDPESWIGRWHHDDGQSFYGKGSPDLGEPIMARPDERLAQNAPEEEGPPPLLARPPYGTGGQPEQAQDFGPPPLLARPAEPAAAGAEPPSGIQIPRSSRIAWVHNNPGNLKYVGQEGASQGEPAEDGGHWAAFQTPEEGAAALQRQIGLDASRGMSARDFVTKYAPPGSNDTEAYIAQASQALGVSPDTKLSDIDPSRVAAFVAQKESGTDLGGGLPAAAPSPAGARMPSAPGSYNGLPLAGVQMRGAPRSAADVQAQVGRVNQRYANLVQSRMAAEQMRAEGRQEAVDYLVQETELDKQNALAEEKRHNDAATAAQARIDKDVNRPIQEVDPKRYVKNMSTGDKVTGAIAVLLSAIGQAANSMLRINSPNLALEMIGDAIDKDIAAQKDAIDRGERQADNRVAHWRQVLGDEKLAERAARAEANTAAGKLMTLRAGQLGEDKERQAALMEYAGQMFAQGQQEIDQILQHENERMLLDFAPPKGTERGPDALLKAIQNSKLAYQELRSSGMTDEQARSAMAEAGVPVLTGETVEQAQKRTDTELAQANRTEDQAIKADEETSKELQPVNEAETAWRGVLAKLNALEQNAMTSKHYKPGGIIAGVTSTWPGWPSQDEQNAFDQSITAATNAQIAALGRASDSDETRIKGATIGAGDVASYRRGIEQRLAELAERRKYLSARRPGAATRIGQRETVQGTPQGEAGVRRPVTGRIGGP
jgi:hypothetical protein